MDSRRIGLRLVELAKAGRDAEAVNELYADNIESVEIISNTTEEPKYGRVSTGSVKNTPGGRVLRQSTVLRSMVHLRVMAATCLWWALAWMSRWKGSVIQCER